MERADRQHGRPGPDGIALGATDDLARRYEAEAPALLAWAALSIRRGGLTALDPDDLVQEVWLRAWRNRDRAAPDRLGFRYWLFRVAKIVLLEMIRDLGRHRRPSGSGSVTQDVFCAVPDPTTAVSRRVSRLESVAKFLDGIEALPQQDRNLVILCGLEGMPYATVARRLDSTEAAVARRWQRLRPTLAQGRLRVDLLAEDPPRIPRG